jgi:hypothetical protein
MKQTKNVFMSLAVMVLLLSAFSEMCPGEETAGPKFMVTVGGNLFRSANTDYRKIYGQSIFMPEIKIARLVYRGIAVWGSFSLIAKNGLIEEVAEKAKIRQTMLSFGLGYMHKLSAALRLRGELGLSYISFKEEALEEVSKGSGLGWKIGADLDYFLNKKLFVTLATGYSQASDEAQTGKIKLGGFQAGAGVGFAF